MEIEKKFSQDWILLAQQGKDLGGYECQRLVKNISSFGGVSTAKRMLKRQGASENFQQLKDLNRLDLSLELLITRGEYTSLFEDEEVNMCLELLCQCNYFG